MLRPERFARKEIAVILRTSTWLTQLNKGFLFLPSPLFFPGLCDLFFHRAPTSTTSFTRRAQRPFSVTAPSVSSLQVPGFFYEAGCLREVRYMPLRRCLAGILQKKKQQISVIRRARMKRGTEEVREGEKKRKQSQVQITKRGSGR